MVYTASARFSFQNAQCSHYLLLVVISVTGCTKEEAHSALHKSKGYLVDAIVKTDESLQ
mgnify:CR=1 FL=1